MPGPGTARQAADQLPKFLHEQTPANRCIKVIHIPTERPGCRLEIIMDGRQALGCRWDFDKNVEPV